MQITREYTKPYRAGMVHNASESAFVRAMANAKWPTHYLGMTSLSGKQRALFLTSYASLEAWEKDGAAVEKNPTLSAAVEAAGVADGAELESVDQGVFVFNEEMSLRPMADLSQMRFMEVSIYHVRPGHEREWSEAVKIVKAAYEKGVPGSHWGVFNQVYGGEGGSYLVLTARKTLAEVDRGFQVENKQFEAALGADGMKKLDEQLAASVESSLHQLFAFNPHMSYVLDDWIKADPDFWKP
ncbi:MAG: hypothetical protein WB723_03190 [Candidatus Acidiferrales bacterium]